MTTLHITTFVLNVQLKDFLQPVAPCLLAHIVDSMSWEGMAYFAGGWKKNSKMLTYFKNTCQTIVFKMEKEGTIQSVNTDNTFSYS